MFMRKIKSKWKIVGITLVAAILFITGCSGGTSKQTASNTGGTKSAETIKIGLLLSQTGSLAPLSESIKKGFDLYLAEHNNTLGGKKVEVKYEDDEGNPQTGLRKFRQLVQGDKVNILVGTTNTAIAYAIRDEVEKDKIVLIDPNAAGDDLSWGKKSNYIYRLSWSNWQNGSSAAPYLANSVGKKAIAIAPDFPAGKEVLGSFTAAFEKAGGKVVKQIYPKMGTNDFASYLSEISQSKPDFVYAFLPGSDGISFIKQYSDFGLKGKIPLSGSLEFGDQLITEPTASVADGIISGIMYSPYLDNSVNKSFVAAYKKKYNAIPNSFSADGYDSAQVIDKAISKAGSVKSEDLVKALKGISFDSPRGPVTIDPNTNNPIQNFYIAKNSKKDGKIVPEILKTVDKVTMPEKSPAK
jgi:branched-chain amino acid transport system substrate-binding protein